MKRLEYLKIVRNKKLVSLFAGLFLIGVFMGCTPRSKYERMVETGLASGERVDSIFLGLNFGMTDKEFYGQCWEMNKQGLIRQGAGNSSVLYEMEDEFKAPVDMNFYPDFYKGRIWRMPVKYGYTGWAPWNLSLSADTLQRELLEKYENWYGDGFMEVRHPLKGSAFVKVDGNRRISISKLDDSQVWVIFTDLLVEKELKALEEAEQDSTETEENPLLDAIEES